jgi:hypothetical protein
MTIAERPMDSSESGTDGKEKKVGPGLIATVSAAAAAFGAVVTVGQSAVEAVRGHYQQQIAMKKAEQELALGKQRGEQDLHISKLKSEQDLALAQRQSDSSLSEAYLKIIFGKDTSESDKFMIVKALSKLDTHPLNAWAKNYETQKAEQIAAIDAANERQSAALASNKPQAEKNVDDLKARIDQLRASYRNSMSSGDVSGAQKTHEATMVLVAKLALAVGEASKLQVAATATSSDGNQTSVRISATLSMNLTVDAVKKAFPAASTRAIETNLPFILAAIDEFKLYDPKFVAVVFGTIRAETPSFAPVSEGKSNFNTAHTPFDLYEPGTPIGSQFGNTEPGDGAKFRGRGYVQITGRTNYLRMSQRLGLGSLLVDRPEEASEPALAARLLCAFIAGASTIRRALEQDDLTRVRKLTNGGSHGLNEFKAAYDTILAGLQQ